MPCRDLLLHSPKFKLLNPNPSSCLLPIHKIAKDGDLIFRVIVKMEISRSIA